MEEAEIRKIVETRKEIGSSAALNLTFEALDEQRQQQHSGSHILLRLHAMCIFEDDQSKIEVALKFAREAVCLYPWSLEYRFFYISLLFFKLQFYKSFDLIMNTTFVVLKCEEALKIDNPMEPYLKLYNDFDNDSSEYLKNRLCNMINTCYMIIDGLPQAFYYDILFFNYDSFDKMIAIASLLKRADYQSCGFAHRMHSEFCFDCAMEVKDKEERDELLEKSLFSARLAVEYFQDSVDYFINFHIRQLQYGLDHRSQNYLLHLNSINYELIKRLRLFSKIEPYYQYLVKNKNNNSTKVMPQMMYYQNCIRFLLCFVATLKFLHKKAIVDDEKFVKIFDNFMKQIKISKLAKKTDFFQKNVKFMLKYKFPSKVQVGLGFDDEINVIKMIVNAYERRGVSHSIRLTRYALRRSESPILFRLYAEYIYENDESEIDLALEFAKKAVTSFSNSMEYRLFYASLLYNKAIDRKMFEKSMFECRDALMMERYDEPFWSYYMTSYYNEVGAKIQIMSFDQVVDYIKRSLRDLFVKCVVDFDDLPPDFFANMILPETSSRHKLWVIRNILVDRYGFCAVVYRIHSDICFGIAIEAAKNGQIDKVERWSDTAFVSAKIALILFKESFDCILTYFTRNLQHGSYFCRRDIKNMKKKLGQFHEAKLPEPYYQHLTHDDNLMDFSRQTEYLRNCANLLLAFIELMEEAEVDQGFQAAAKYESYYQKLEGSDLGLINLTTKELEYFNINIKFLLEKKLHNMRIFDKKEAHMISCDKIKKKKSKKKKNKNKKKKKKGNGSKLNPKQENISTLPHDSDENGSVDMFEEFRYMMSQTMKKLGILEDPESEDKQEDCEQDWSENQQEHERVDGAILLPDSENDEISVVGKPEEKDCADDLSQNQQKGEDDVVDQVDKAEECLQDLSEDLKEDKHEAWDCFLWSYAITIFLSMLISLAMMNDFNYFYTS